MTTAILGGTFDPFHRGHLAMAEAAVRELHPDSLWILPSGNPPYREEHSVTEGAIRLKMAQDAIAEEPDETVRARLSVCPDEVLRAGKTYTADTLAVFHRRDPKRRFILVCGADSLMTMHRWVGIASVCALADIACFCRPGETAETACCKEAERLRAAAGARVTFLTAAIPEISSREIRRKCRSGEDISDLVPPAVLRDIETFALYRGEGSRTGQTLPQN